MIGCKSVVETGMYMVVCAGGMEKDAEYCGAGILRTELEPQSLCYLARDSKLCPRVRHCRYCVTRGGTDTSTAHARQKCYALQKFPVLLPVHHS